MIPIFVKRLGRGLVAGAIATVPMSATMQLMHRWPWPERDSLPPHQITKRITAKLGIKKHLNHEQLTALTIANHFGFGGAMGGLYALFAPCIIAPPVVKGLVWGSLVWALSYLGWLPVAHILPPATEHSKRRNFLMIVAHLVWGVSTALLAESGQKDK